MIGATRAHTRLGGHADYRSPKELALMPHPLPLLAAAAAPLLGLAVHVASTHAGTAPTGHAASALPHNLCSSCHGGGNVASLEGALGARDLVAANAYLQVKPRG